MSDPAKISRRLVAVFAADVEGYSRLMGPDEVGTLKGLTERRAILDRLIGDHGGHIANTAGDSVLAEFGSAVDMDYDLGYFDDETCRLEPLANPFGPKVLPLSSV